MATTESPVLFDELLDLLAETADPERVLKFRLSEEKQQKLDDLLEKNREGTLTPDETSELESFERFEHVVRMLKARLMRNQAS